MAPDSDELIETERDRVIEAVTTVFIEADRRDWAAVQSCFADDVFFDLSASCGGPPGMTTPGRIAQAWTEGTKELKASHHQAGNFLVHIKKDTATVFCYGITFHYLADLPKQDIRTYVGSYEFHLARSEQGWRIDTMVYHPRFVIGAGSPGSRK